MVKMLVRAAPRIWSAAELLPGAWQCLSRGGPVRVFNPGLLRLDSGFLLAYRVVLPDGRRRLGLCRLDRDLAVVPGSPVPLSDRLTVETADGPGSHEAGWFADPRLVQWGAGVWLHWNSGVHQPRNYQFLQQLDPVGLGPTGPSRELVRREGCAPIEKNWGLFAVGEELWAVYSLAPLRLLRLTAADPRRFVFDDIGRGCWDDTRYARRFGELRGGAPPQAVAGQWFAFAHSRFRTSRGIRYVPAAMAFAGSPGRWRATGCCARPLPLPNPFGDRFVHERLNASVAGVVYPGGSAHEQGEWVVSYGINDEHCAAVRLDHEALLRRLRPVSELPDQPDSAWDMAVNNPPVSRWQHWLRVIGRS
jgi:hypothetical protein